MRASKLAKTLRAEYQRGYDDGCYGVPPDPGIWSSHPGVHWAYEDLRRLTYDAGHAKGRELRAASWARPIKTTPHPDPPGGPVTTDPTSVPDIVAELRDIDAWGDPNPVDDIARRAADEIERLRPYRDILAGIMDDDVDVYVQLYDTAVCIDGWLDLTPTEVQALRALTTPQEAP